MKSVGHAAVVSRKNGREYLKIICSLQMYIRGRHPHENEKAEPRVLARKYRSYELRNVYVPRI